MSALGGAPPTRAAIEDFLYLDAALLDEWKLDAWLSLFAPEARYQVPPLDVPDGDPATTLFLINDDLDDLRVRVRHLCDGLVLSEVPRSRTRRFISNVRLVEAGPSDELVRVTANFAVHRFRDGRRQDLIGRHHHVLRRTPDGLCFVLRRAVLDLESFAPVGVLSVLL